MVWGQMNLATWTRHCLSDGLHFREIDVPDIGWKICSHCEREKRRGEREKGGRGREGEGEREKGELNYAANAYICSKASKASLPGSTISLMVFQSLEVLFPSGGFTCIKTVYVNSSQTLNHRNNSISI